MIPGSCAALKAPLFHPLHSSCRTGGSDEAKKQKAAFARRPLFSLVFIDLVFIDHAEVAIGVTGTGGEEQLVFLAVEGGTAAELNAPQPIDDEIPAGGILHNADQLA